MCYFDLVFTNPTETIDSICHQLNNPQLGNIDHIVGAGVSGTMLLVPVSIKSGIPCCVVRKQTDNEGGSHSSSTIEIKGLSRYVGRYAIIDDFIESGATKEKGENQWTKTSTTICYRK
jgi:adenine/guanine phosphoribosyltransferase-like PRPP-binding protein